MEFFCKSSIARISISYGARVGITTGGTLKFGTQSTAATAAGSRIQTSIVPQAKEFPSEFPHIK